MSEKVPYLPGKSVAGKRDLHVTWCQKPFCLPTDNPSLVSTEEGNGALLDVKSKCSVQAAMVLGESFLAEDGL